MGARENFLALAVDDIAATLQGCCWIRLFDQVSAVRRRVCACFENLMNLADLGDTGSCLGALRQLYGTGPIAQGAGAAHAGEKIM